MKFFWVKKILGSKKYFRSKKFLLKNFLDHKNFGSKNILGKKILVKKIWIRFFFCLKKQVGLTQGGGYMTPPRK